MRQFSYLLWFIRAHLLTYFASYFTLFTFLYAIAWWSLSHTVRVEYVDSLYIIFICIRSEIRCQLHTHQQNIIRCHRLMIIRNTSKVIGVDSRNEIIKRFFPNINKEKWLFLRIYNARMQFQQLSLLCSIVTFVDYLTFFASLVSNDLITLDDARVVEFVLNRSLNFDQKF